MILALPPPKSSFCHYPIQRLSYEGFVGGDFRMYYLRMLECFRMTVRVAAIHRSGVAMAGV